MKMPLKVKIVKPMGQREETSGLNAQAAADAQPAAAWGRKPGFGSPASASFRRAARGTIAPLIQRGSHLPVVPQTVSFLIRLSLAGMTSTYQGTGKTGK